MINRILLLTVAILSIIYFSINSSSNTTFFTTSPNINVKTDNNQIESLDLEEYIIGVVAAEMPASFNKEALKAQAVAARTYAVYKIQNSKKEYDVVTSVSNQRYITVDEMKNKWENEFDKYYSKVVAAVEETIGEVMIYNNQIVEAYYFAMSNGYTENASLVFSENKDYLQSVESNYDTSVKNFIVKKEFTKEEICNKLDLECNKLLFTDIKRSDTNRVNYITVNGKIFKGTEFRKKLGLRSTDFNISINDNTITITTKGYGHGVGMSQYGANGMAKEGYSYSDILKYFYKNVEISSI